MSSRHFIFGLVALSGWLPSKTAQAGGFYLLERGTESMARGGANVAAVHDSEALWINPAGLAFATEHGFRLDAGLPLVETSFSRAHSYGVEYAPVSAWSTPVPVPSFSLHTRIASDWTLGFAILAPNAVTTDWPERVGSEAAPQRYATLSLAGTWVALPTVGVAYRAAEWLAIGLTAQLAVGQFGASVAVTGCDGFLCTYPEDPRYDAIARFDSPISVSPVFGLGAAGRVGSFRWGASLMSNYTLSGRGQARMRLPSAAAFDEAFAQTTSGACATSPTAASNVNDPCRQLQADATVAFPWIFRLGLGWAFSQSLDVEISGVYETWSMQRDITIQPVSVQLKNILGAADYDIGALAIPRGLIDTLSLRLGGSWTVANGLTLRAGAMFETAAVADAYTSALTPDSSKIIGALGANIALGDAFGANLSLDLAAGYAYLLPRQVTNSALRPIAPLRPEDTSALAHANGSYSYQAPFLSLGVVGRWSPN